MGDEPLAVGLVSNTVSRASAGTGLPSVIRVNSQKRVTTTAFR
jgi:hypothetical protein